jgi:hypothetical protein
MFPVVDVSDTTMAASGTTKKISVNNILSSSPTASGALTVTGLVTAGSATITGDLTVDTSTLKVDSTNNRVGIGTATPSYPLHVKLDQNAYTFSRIDNQNASSGAYAALMLAASGNTWGIGIGSTAANSNALDFFLDAGGANSVKMTLNSTGNLVFPSAKGIDFSATADGSGTMTSELLNDYEEGTFTPGITFGGASVGMTGTFNGRYTKVGRAVTISGLIALSAKGTSTGTAVLTGLPFASSNGAGSYTAICLRYYNTSFSNAFQGYLSQNTSTVTLEQITTGGTVNVMSDSNFTNSSAMIVNFTYDV